MRQAPAVDAAVTQGAGPPEGERAPVVRLTAVQQALFTNDEIAANVGRFLPTLNDFENLEQALGRPVAGLWPNFSGGDIHRLLAPEIKWLRARGEEVVPARRRLPVPARLPDWATRDAIRLGFPPQLFAAMDEGRLDTLRRALRHAYTPQLPVLRQINDEAHERKHRALHTTQTLLAASRTHLAAAENTPADVAEIAQLGRQLREVANTYRRYLFGAHGTQALFAEDVKAFCEAAIGLETGRNGALAGALAILPQLLGRVELGLAFRQEAHNLNFPRRRIDPLEDFAFA